MLKLIEFVLTDTTDRPNRTRFSTEPQTTTTNKKLIHTECSEPNSMEKHVCNRTAANATTIFLLDAVAVLVNQTCSLFNEKEINFYYRFLTPTNIVYWFAVHFTKKKLIGSCVGPRVSDVGTLERNSRIAQERYAKTPVHQLKSHL